MAEDTQNASTGAGSDGDQSTSGDASTGSGNAGDATGAGSQADAEQFAAEREAAERERRQLQSELDKAKAELAALTSKGGSSSDSSASMTPEQVRLEIVRGHQISQAALTLRSDDSVKYADPSLFDRVAEFDSVEAFKAAVETSHKQMAARLDSLGVIPKSEAEAAAAALREKYGDVPAPPDGNGGTPTGELTADQMRSMSFDERDAYDEEHGKGAFAKQVQKHLRPRD